MGFFSGLEAFNQCSSGVQRVFSVRQIAALRGVSAFRVWSPGSGIYRFQGFEIAGSTTDHTISEIKPWPCKTSTDMSASVSLPACLSVHVCICMYMYVYVCVCVCVYVCMQACMYVCMDTCMYVCMYLCICVSMYGCVHVCMYACMYVCTYARACLRTYACMYVRSMYVCMYVCMYACAHVCMRVLYACMKVHANEGIGLGFPGSRF